MFSGLGCSGVGDKDATCRAGRTCAHMPYVTDKYSGNRIHVTDDMLETCPRCQGKGWYNYWPDENKLKMMFYRLTGRLRCILCGGSGSLVTVPWSVFYSE
jgi:hypothetical protein